MIRTVFENTPDLVPQAVLKLPVESVVSNWGGAEHGYDDFDEFEGLSFALDNNLFFAVRHYQGHPKGTSTLYIDHRVVGVQEITDLLGKILSELGVSTSFIEWQRRDDPDL